MAELTEGQISQMKKEDRTRKKYNFQKNQAQLFNNNSSSNRYVRKDQFEKKDRYDRNSQSERNKVRNLRCFRCDREGHMARSDSCPARNKKCITCSKIGHFAVVCRDKKRGRGVKLISTEKPGEDSLDSKKDIRSSSSEEDIWRIEDRHRFSSEIEILVEEIPIKFIIDSGAGVNIIDSHRYGKMKGRRLYDTSMKLYTYGSDIPLKLEGKMNCQIEYKGQQIDTDIYVVASKFSGCLLGKETAEKLNILKIQNISSISTEGKSGTWNKEIIVDRFTEIQYCQQEV